MSVTVNVGGGNVASTLTSPILSQAIGLTAYAHDRATAVDGFISNLASQLISLVPPTIEPYYPVTDIPPAVIIPDAPQFAAPVWVAPNMPAAFSGSFDISDLSMPTFSGTAPALHFTDAPAPFVGSLPDAPVVDVDFTLPDLTVTLPAAPPLMQLDVQPFGGINLPTFDATAPVLTAVAPSIREYVPSATYTSNLLEGLKTTLLDRITSGGTGLTADVENAIWDRSREREALSQADSLAALDQMEELGYALPPGAYLAARTKIITETNYTLVGNSREIMIKSSELMLDNIKMALTTSVTLEGQLLEYTNSTEQRLFEASKYATEAGISIYNAQITAFGALVEVYKSQVQVYTALIQGEQAKVDTYRAQIAAEQAKASINDSLIQQYKIQSDVALSAIDIFKARISAIQTKAEIEKTKVDIFGAQVQGYTAQVNAYTAGVEGYRASIQGEAAKQDAYKSSVDAFAAQVQSVASIIDARVKGLEGLVAAKTAELDGYRAAIAGESARVDALTKTSSVAADAYKSTVAAVGTYNEVLTKQWQAGIDEGIQAAQIGVQAAKANGDLYVSTRGLALDATKTGAQVAAQLGAAAINAVNFSASVSSSESVQGGISYSQSSSTSSSSSEGTSTNYNYNSSV